MNYVKNEVLVDGEMRTFYVVQSTTRSMEHYVVDLKQQSCTCLAWKHYRHRHGACKHLRWFNENVGLPVQLSLPGLQNSYEDML